MGLWAQAELVDSSVAPSELDVDALELWGPEPHLSDADRFSVRGDRHVAGDSSRVSVWNDDGEAYLFHEQIVAAIVELFPRIRDHESYMNQVDVDALMVSSNGADQFGPDDQILFSIQQIPDANAPVGPHIVTGQELILLHGSEGASFLNHGGHLWDSQWAAENPS